MQLSVLKLHWLGGGGQGERNASITQQIRTPVRAHLYIKSSDKQRKPPGSVQEIGGEKIPRGKK